MTVAPEWPPAPADRPGPARRRGRATLRAVPVLVDRTPAGVVAVVEETPTRGHAVPRGVVTDAPSPSVGPVGSGSGVGVAERRVPAARASVEQTWPVETPTLLPEPELAPADQPWEPASRPVAVRRPVGARVVRPARPGLRLTVRGRLVVAAAILVLAGLALVGVASRVGTLHGSPVPASAPSQVVVAPGETLWSIAQRVAPDRDPRTVVDQIRRLNDLPTSEVRTGQTLVLRAP